MLKWTLLIWALTQGTGTELSWELKSVGTEGSEDTERSVITLVLVDQVSPLGPLEAPTFPTQCLLLFL